MSALSAGILSAIGGAAEAGNEYAKQERTFEHERGMLDTKNEFQSKLEELRYANQQELAEFEKGWRTELETKKWEREDIKSSEEYGRTTQEGIIEREHEIELERIRQEGRADSDGGKLPEATRKKFEENFTEILFESLDKVAPGETELNLQRLRETDRDRYNIYRAFKEAMLEAKDHDDAILIYRTYRDLLSGPKKGPATTAPGGGVPDLASKYGLKRD